MRTHVIAAILLSTLLAGAGTPKQGAPGDAPLIELADAVAKAKAYAREHHLDLSRQYLKGASFDPVARTWEIDWQIPRAKGGNTLFVVPEVGAITVQSGK